MENNWVNTISVVSFDENIGQQVEFQIPTYFSQAEQRTLAFLSFPDSNCFSTGDLTYTFKIGDTFCFAYFRQVRDASKSRGYLQQSLVLSSKLPYISLFRQVLSMIGPLFFQFGRSLLEVIQTCFNDWGEIVPGATKELPLLGKIITYKIPTTDLQAIQETDNSDVASILERLNEGYPGMFQDADIFAVVSKKALKTHIWSLWEAVVCEENLMIFSPTPDICSMMVLGLLALASPLVYAGEYFPYTNVFDPDFKRTRNCVLGVTNPFFKKSIGDAFSIWEINCNIEPSFSLKFKPSFRPFKSVFTKNGDVKKHFRDLTLALLHPFQKYFYCDSSDDFKKFSREEFLADIANRPVPLLDFTTKKRTLRVYSKFTQTDTFKNWFEQQVARTKHNFEKIMSETEEYFSSDNEQVVDFALII